MLPPAPLPAPERVDLPLPAGLLLLGAAGLLLWVLWVWTSPARSRERAAHRELARRAREGDAALRKVRWVPVPITDPETAECVTGVRRKLRVLTTVDDHPAVGAWPGVEGEDDAG